MATVLLERLKRRPYNPPLPKTLKVKTEKALTIGIGIKCTDGIVLAADTQITFPGSHKYYESKIFTVDYSVPGSRTIFTFAGYPVLMKTFRDKFTEASRRSDFEFSVSGVKDAVEGILQEMNPEKDGLHMLGVSFVSGNISLLRTSETSVHEVHLYDYVGIGDSALIRYLSSLLLTQPVSVKIGSLIASYFVTKAKELIDGCGGETELVQLMTDGKVHSFMGSFKDREIQMAEFHIKQLIYTVFTPSMSEDLRRQALENLSTSLRDILSS